MRYTTGEADRLFNGIYSKDGPPQSCSRCWFLETDYDKKYVIGWHCSKDPALQRYTFIGLDDRRMVGCPLE